MQITLNQTEVENAIQAYIDGAVNVEGDISIHVNEDGTATVLIGDEEAVADDTPPVVEKQKRTRRKRNPAEAKHVPVEAAKELQTTDGGQSETTTQEQEVQDAGDSDGQTGAATIEQEEDTSVEVEAEQQQEEVVEEEVKEEAQVEEKPAATAKPSLFANLKR